MKRYIGLIIILIITALAVVVDIPNAPDLNLKRIGIDYKRVLQIHLGLDLQGGTQLVYEADMSGIPASDQLTAIEAAKEVIDRRINALGVSEPVIQTSQSGNNSRIIVELPGIKDVNQAISLIGKTAQLKFEEQDDKGNFKDTALTGKHLTKAQVQYNAQTRALEISVEFNSEGTKLFAEITKRNIKKPLAIYLDDQVVSAPVVQAVIDDGKAVITGSFDQDTAKQLAIQLNAGALPVPIKIVSQLNVGATLGQEAVKNSILAGIVGLLLISLFMILYYRFSGIFAVIALIFYSLYVVALFKLIPVTLTLAGIAGFILSIGMAVDANILIFERMKEEIRNGRMIGLALEEGFRRAWSSIRDSNVSSIITALILYWFGGSGIIKGFAVTLIIGILISLFTAITVTRTLMRLLVNRKISGKWLVGI